MNLRAFREIIILVYLFLDRFVKEPYGSLLSVLKQHHSLRQDQYPTTIVEAIQLLKVHDWDHCKTNLNKSQQQW